MSVTRLKQHRHCLHVLASAAPKQRRAILITADKSLVCCLCECIQNVLSTQVPIAQKTKNQLKKYRNVLESMIDKRKSIASKRKILTQSGGFLPILLPALLGVIAQIVGDTVNKHV